MPRFLPSQKSGHGHEPHPDIFLPTQNAKNKRTGQKQIQNTFKKPFGLGNFGTIETIGKPQDESLACPAPKLHSDNCRLDFGQTTNQIYNFVRGLAPHPTAYTLLDGQVLKVYATEKDNDTPVAHPVGTILTDGKKYVKIATASSYIYLTDVQLAGKKRLDIRAFLNGYTPKNGLIG